MKIVTIREILLAQLVLVDWDFQRRLSTNQKKDSAKRGEWSSKAMINMYLVLNVESSKMSTYSALRFQEIYLQNSGLKKFWLDCDCFLTCFMLQRVKDYLELQEKIRPCGLCCSHAVKAVLEWDWTLACFLLIGRDFKQRKSSNFSNQNRKDFFWIPTQ